jgi:hypothetical protein
MNIHNKHLVIFLLLAMLSNGLFAAQMTASMINKVPAQIAADQVSLPCHSAVGLSIADGKTDGMSCCDGDCSSCILSVHLTEMVSISPIKYHHQRLIQPLRDYLLSAHRSNLFKPPIFI